MALAEHTNMVRMDNFMLDTSSQPKKEQKRKQKVRRKERERGRGRERQRGEAIGHNHRDQKLTKLQLGRP